MCCRSSALNRNRSQKFNDAWRPFPRPLLNSVTHIFIAHSLLMAESPFNLIVFIDAAVQSSTAEDRVSSMSVAL
jgi:hypothetical protein